MSKSASLSEQSRDVLQSNSAVVTISCSASPKACNGLHSTGEASSSSSNITLQYSTPCSMASSVQESMSTLLAARAYAKMGDSKAAWQALDALFFAGDGLLPRFRYFGRDSDEYYLSGTTIPNWRIFGTSPSSSSWARTSNRLSSAPMHASFVLETFYLTNQTQDDLNGLERAFWRLWNHHEYMHTVILRHCPGAACYNVIHPWETDDETPLPPSVLAQINLQIQASRWVLPFDVPLQVRQAWNYDKETYPALIYLLECHSNATRDCDGSNATMCEDARITSCPYRMLHVGHAAALLQSNRDLQIMADILVDAVPAPSKVQLLQLSRWEETSQQIVDSLWNDAKKSFLPKTASGWMLQPMATNFLGLWAAAANTSWVEDMTFHLMQHSGDFAFDCGEYPLWSVGGCKSNASISPLLNYVVSRGLVQNDMNGLGHYVSNSTVNLLCRSRTNDEQQQDGDCSNILFATAFDASTNLPFASLDACSLSWTTTAAVAYHLAVPDKAFSYTPPPPIRASWVIVLVLAELIVAFSMGMSCLLLSLTLMRRLNDVTGEDGLLLDDDSLNFFSAAGGSDDSSRDGSGTGYGREEGNGALDRTLLVGYDAEEYASSNN